MTRGLGTSEPTAALRRLRGALLAVGAFSGCLNLLMLAPSLYMLQVYDRVLSSRNEATLVMLTLVLMLAYGLTSGLEAIRTWVLVRLGSRLDAALELRVFGAAFDRTLLKPGSSAAQPIEDLNTVRQVLTGPGLLTMLDAPWVPVYLVAIALMSVELAVFATLGAGVLVVLAFLNERLAKAPLVEAQRHNQRAQATLHEHFRGAEVIEAMGMLDGIRRRWHVLHARHLSLQSQASDRAAVLSGVTRFVRMAMQSLALGLGAWLVLEDRMSPGGMIAASVLVSRALAPVEMMIANWRQIVMGRSAYARLESLLASHPVRRRTMALPPPRGALQVDDVSVFAPGTQRPILLNINLKIDAGECVAIIGPSGCGKSTLARLLVGVRTPDRGTVRLDGADLRQWDRLELGPFLGYLPQDIDLFDGTVAENIARFRTLDPDRVLTAARRAGVHENILAMPQGYETRLGAGGGNLSGGQRQRVALARALYGQPSLVVLDEPNSNLDDSGERALLNAVRALTAAGVTVVLVTHRVATLAVAQKLIVLQDGQLKAVGPRDAVLNAMRGGTPAAGPVPPGAATAPARDDWS